MRAGDVHGTTGPDSRARRLSVRTASVQDYFQRRCEQQPSPNARETRPPRGRVFRFLRSVFEGWARAAGAAVSRSLNRRVARTPPLADRMGRKSLRVSRGAGCRVKSGSVPLERSLPPGSAPQVRSRTVANRDPRVMSANVATSLFRSIRLGVRPPTGFPRRRGAELRATMLRARGPRA